MVDIIQKDLFKQKIRVGSLRIQAHEFINILKSYDEVNSSQVRAEANGYRMNSFEEIESNLELICGKPNIRIDFSSTTNMTIDFDDGAEIKLNGDISEAQIILAEKLRMQLHSFRREYFFLGNKALDILFYIMVSIALVRSLYLESYDFQDPLQIYTSIAAFIIFVLSVYIKIFQRLPAVVLREKDSFWGRLHNGFVEKLLFFSIGAAFAYLTSILGVQS